MVTSYFETTMIDAKARESTHREEQNLQIECKFGLSEYVLKYYI